MAESEEELKSVLMKMKEESDKASLKLNIQKTKNMALDSITSWQVAGEKVERMSHFIFLGSKVNADIDCSHIIKIHLLLERIAMTNLDNVQCIKKQRHHFANKGPNSQSYGFSSSQVWM